MGRVDFAACVGRRRRKLLFITTARPPMGQTGVLQELAYHWTRRNPGNVHDQSRYAQMLRRIPERRPTNLPLAIVQVRVKTGGQTVLATP